MNIMENILAAEKTVQMFNDIPTERPSGALALNLMVESGPHTGYSHKKHYAKMIASFDAFKATFQPDDPYITCLDASFFGYEVRYERNGVIVDCLMTKEQIKDFYGDIKLARIVKGADRVK